MRGLTFDLVLLDVMMPGESGLDLARDLKTISNVPICMSIASKVSRLASTILFPSPSSRVSWCCDCGTS
jgi:CheY-like chemotaxis protein